MIKVIVLATLVLFGCQEPKIYECEGWTKRPCVCPSGEEGVQRCSNGPAFLDPPPPRVWLPCSCCFDKQRDEHGVYYIDQRDASGCWEDAYDPSVSEFLKDIGNNAK